MIWIDVPNGDNSDVIDDLSAVVRTIDRVIILVSTQY